jgi:hypothetical protein
MTTELAISDQPLTIKALQNMLAGSTLPDRYEYVGDAIATIKVGSEVGLPPMTALMELYVVNGSVGMSGKAMQSLVFRAGHMIIKTEMTPERAAVRAMRYIPQLNEHMDMGEYEFTIEDAERAGLTEKSNYESFPKDMLLWKAVARAVRFVFPDVIMGYLPSEIGVDVEEYDPEAGVLAIEEEGDDEVFGHQVTVTEAILEAEEVAEILDGSVTE